MDFNEQFPEYRAIAQHIRAARAETSFSRGHGIATALVTAGRFVKQLLPSRWLQQREA